MSEAKTLNVGWISLHEPHGLLTFDETSSNLMGFLCLRCEETSLASPIQLGLTPGALDLYIRLAKEEESLLISRILKKG